MNYTYALKLYNRIGMRTRQSVTRHWVSFWMRHAGLNLFGRIATRLASSFAPPYQGRVKLARLSPKGFIAPSASIHHPNLLLGSNICLDDRVLIYQSDTSGHVQIGDRVVILRDTIIETGQGGSVTLGPDVYIHPRCQLNAYKAPIQIGTGVLIAANCAFYPHSHGTLPGVPIREQPLQTKGGIVVGEHAWIGASVTVLGGVNIGKGAVIGAGSVVTRDVPEGAIVAGVPARVVKMRDELSQPAMDVVGQPGTKSSTT